MTAVKNVGMWHRGVERRAEHSITPGDARTFANPTCGTSARLMNLYSSYVCDFVWFCRVAVVSIFFLLRYTIGESGMGLALFLFVLFLFLFFGS